MTIKAFSPALVMLAPLLMATSCFATGSFYVANLSPQPLRVEYTQRCEPCVTPKLIGVAELRRSRGLSYYADHLSPAPVEVRGRTDSLLTYSILLPPQFAVLLFERSVPSGLIGGGKAEPQRDFAEVALTAETSNGRVTYSSANVGEALRRWHKLIYVIELP
jgi:hypothetical protein